MPVSVPTSAGTAKATAAATTIAVNTSVLIPAGAKLWAVIMVQNGASTVTSITGGPTFGKDQEGVATATLLSIWSADVVTDLAAGTALTANFASSSDRMIALFYSSGVQVGAAAAYGAVGQNQTAATAWSSTATAVRQADILIGASHLSIASGSPTSTATGGNTEVFDDTTADGEAMTVVYQYGSGGAITAQGTWTSSGTIRSAAVAYLAAPDPPVTPLRFIYLRKNK